MMGENGSGKSTILQSILILKQSVRENNQDISNLILNGDYCNIGNGRDALCRSSDDAEVISFRVEMQTTKSSDTTELKFKYEPEADFLQPTGQPIAATLFSDAKVTYLAAERTGPRLTTPFSKTKASAGDLGRNGTGSAAVLFANSSTVMSDKDPRIPKELVTRNILSVFNHYLGLISTGASIKVAGFADLDSVATTFNFENAGLLPIESIRPTNVGFGLSYSISIIISCLQAKPGDILLIENPEAHLHTKGQRAIADLICKTADTGVQIILETHSREILYWLRQKVINKELPAETVRLNYLSSSDRGEDSLQECPTLFPLSDQIGELGDATQEFLDHFGTSMDFIQNTHG
tara:strand:+ start:1786 stop:2838 length:1053 start_codon:yes stop_codon:yes gene_type:complete